MLGRVYRQRKNTHHRSTPRELSRNLVSIEIASNSRLHAGSASHQNKLGMLMSSLVQASLPHGRNIPIQRLPDGKRAQELKRPTTPT